MDVVDALGVIYPQYWLQGDCEASFQKHLTVIKDFYGESRSVVHDGVRTVAPPILDKYRLESEQPLFKMAMVANSPWAMEPPTIGSDASKPLLNSVTKLWHRLDANSVLSTSFPEYIKRTLLPCEWRAESGERRAVIWRAVSNEKPIIVKNISYFRNYF